jgi:hypothetical protein
VLDLAGVLQRHQLQQVINEAERLRFAAATNHPTKRGTNALRTLAPPTHTRLRVTWRDLREPGRLAAELAPFF